MADAGTVIQRAFSDVYGFCIGIFVTFSNFLSDLRNPVRLRICHIEGQYCINCINQTRLLAR